MRRLPPDTAGAGALRALRTKLGGGQKLVVEKQLLCSSFGLPLARVAVTRASPDAAGETFEPSENFLSPRDRVVHARGPLDELEGSRARGAAQVSSLGRLWSSGQAGDARAYNTRRENRSIHITAHQSQRSKRATAAGPRTSNKHCAADPAQPYAVDAPHA